MSRIFRPTVHPCAWLLVLGVCMLAGCDDKPTIEVETRAKKRKEVVESFSDAAAIEGSEAPAGIKKFFDDFAEAAAARNAERMSQLMDYKMMIEACKQQKLMPAKFAGMERALIEAIDTKLSVQLTDPVLGVTWRTHQIRRVRMIRDDTEALVYVRHWDEDDITTKMRWWLYNDGDRWRAYDLEILDLSMRYSTTMGIGLKMADQKDLSKQNLQRLLQTIQLVAEGELESSLNALRELDSVKFPPMLEAVRLFMIAGIHLDFMEYDDVLEYSRRALRIQPDTPLVLLTVAQAHNGLGQHHKALEHAELYAKMLGKDADYYETVGSAHRGLGQIAKAVDAYKLGVADDPLHGRNLLGLMKMIPHVDVQTVIEHYKALRGIDEWFIGLGDILVAEEDANTLQALIEIHKQVMPKDENLAYFEAALEELRQ